MTRIPHVAFTFAIALLALAACAASASAAEPTTTAPLFASYWHDFLDHWLGLLKKQNGIIVAILLVGAASLVIITRGKWKK